VRVAGTRRGSERDRMDLAIEIMLDLEFLRSNPSDEVARQYALDQLRQAAQRSARNLLPRLPEGW